MGESESANKINMIGVGTTIEGSINSNENIRFDGNLIGNLNTKGKGFYWSEWTSVRRDPL